MLRLRQGAYRDLAEEATLTWLVGTRSEVRWQSQSVPADPQDRGCLAKDCCDQEFPDSRANWHTRTY
ncbi:hypothetical protein [Paracoccus mutanolyticus]|uniref:hypothetical protein n=1 Tax=Paracoccus mutanolyticus TaxID=1499308 RepID=UPI0037C82899